MNSLSIITVALNSAATLEQCILSVNAQQVDCEHVVIDGGSTDGTSEIIERHRNSSFKFLSELDTGIYDAMNKGIALAGGDIIGFLNADDYYPNEAVLKTVLEVFADPKIDACYGDLKYVDLNDTKKTVRFWRSGAIEPRKFYYGWMPPHPTFFVRKQFYEQFGGFNTALGSAADYELMLRFLLKHGLKTEYIPSVLVHMRTGGVSNALLSSRLRANRLDREAWKVNGLRPYPWTLAFKPLRKLGQWFSH